MIAILRLAVFGFIILTVVYVLVSIYSRSVRRERLEKEYDARIGAGGAEGSRDDYIKAGMDHYQHGLRRRLILLVYVIPTLAVIATVWYVNYQ